MFEEYSGNIYSQLPEINPPRAELRQVMHLDAADQTEKLKLCKVIKSSLLTKRDSTVALVLFIFISISTSIA
jgi:hypothetical protein